jgi:hypothetical protein
MNHPAWVLGQMMYCVSSLLSSQISGLPSTLPFRFESCMIIDDDEMCISAQSHVAALPPSSSPSLHTATTAKNGSVLNTSSPQLTIPRY